MVDEIDRRRMLREEARGAVVRTKQDGGAAVAARELERACGRGAALLGGNHESWFVVERDRARRRDQRRGAGAQRARDVERRSPAADVERLRNDAGVLPVVERRAGRSEIERRDDAAAVV